MTGSFDKDAWILRAIDSGKLRVSRDGRAFRPGTYTLVEIPLQTHKKTGRVYFNFTFEGVTKSILINRAVGLKYLPNPLNLPQVNHIDGVKAHNWVECEKHPVSNLEWSSKSHNEKHAFGTGLKSNRGTSNGNSKLTPADIVKIREAPADNLAALAQSLKVSRKTISDIRAHKTWSHV
jgi:hypothetical protein